MAPIDPTLYDLRQDYDGQNMLDERAVTAADAVTTLGEALLKNHDEISDEVQEILDSAEDPKEKISQLSELAGDYSVDISLEPTSETLTIYTLITRYNASGMVDTIQHFPSQRARLESILDRIAGFEDYDDGFTARVLAEIDSDINKSIDAAEAYFVEDLAEYLNDTNGEIELFEANLAGPAGYYYGEN